MGTVMGPLQDCFTEDPLIASESHRSYLLDYIKIKMRNPNSTYTQLATRIRVNDTGHAFEAVCQLGLLMKQLGGLGFRVHLRIHKPTVSRLSPTTEGN